MALSAPHAARSATPVSRSRPIPGHAAARRPGAIFGSQVDNRSRQGVFIVATDRWTALRRAVLADHTTGTALRYIEPVLHVIDRGTPACGA